MSWCEQAVDRLNNEIKEVKGQKEGVMKYAVKESLVEFCRQNEEFAQAVVQGGSFPDCMATVAKGVGSSISDIDAFRKAAGFYFDGAKVEFRMEICLEPTESVPEKHIVIDLSDFF